VPLVRDDFVPPTVSFAPDRYGIEPGTPPPHAILHCCLRA